MSKKLNLFLKIMENVVLMSELIIYTVSIASEKIWATPGCDLSFSDVYVEMR